MMNPYSFKVYKQLILLPFGSSKLNRHCFLIKSHILIVLSSEPDIILFFSISPILNIVPLCPLNLIIGSLT